MSTDLARARARLPALPALLASLTHLAHLAHLGHLALTLTLTLTLALGASLAHAQAPSAAAAAPAASAPQPALDSRVQDLKAELIALNRDLLVLEEDLLFPPGTQLAVFLSLDVGELFELESVKVLLDDKLVASHLYSPLEIQALQRGGVQRLFLGNLRTGKHQLAAVFTGRGPQQGKDRRDYKRATQLDFEKATEPRYVELRIRDKQANLQPEFEVKVWP